MKPLDKNDYCRIIGLDPYLSEYPKTHEQADYLLKLVDRLKRSHWGIEADRDSIKSHEVFKKREREIKDAIELLRDMDVRGAEDLYYEEDIDVLLYETRSLSAYNKEVRDKLWKELAEQGFTNIEKLIAAINTVVRDENSNE